jgi:hypothetical protein
VTFFQNEKLRLRAEVQAAEAQITGLTAQLQTQQQAVSAAQAQVTAAQARVSAAQALIPPLQAAATEADENIVQADAAIEAHAANEPDRLIEVDGRPPRPNPAWRTWQTQMARLTQGREQLGAASAAAHRRLSDGVNQVSQAAAEKSAADRQVADALLAVQTTQPAIAAARQRQEAAQAESAGLDRWNDEIARDPLVRTALEQVAADVSARAAVLQDAHDVARVQHEIAEETHAALIARRDQLTPALNQVNAQLPAASQELQAARQALGSANGRIQTHRRRGPLQ